MLASLILLNACAAGGDYTPPKNDLVDEWGALDADMEAIEDADTSTIAASAGITISNNEVLDNRWWETFDDKILSSLMEEALEENHDLKIAKARIAEAEADEYYASAQRWPEVNLSGSLARSSLDAIGSSKADTIRQAGISGNWDIDPFGQNLRRQEAATANAEASEAEFAQARLDLLAHVARNYSRLRAMQKLRELTLRNLGTQRDTLGVTRELRKAQNVTELDVARVEAQVAATQARLPQIRTEILAAINRLGVLTGKQPSTLRNLLLPKKPMLLPPESLVVLSPIATIAQRPDVHAAERRLAEAAALSNAAFAGFFPKLSLGAFFGTRHSDFYGGLSPWSATADALFPLLDFGRIRSQMQGADARQEQAFHHYKQTVLTALEDTENSLNAYMGEQQRSVLLHRVAVEQARAVTIAREQYRGGIVTQLDLLDAQRNQLEAESNWVLSEQAAIDNLIGLYRSLGQSSSP